MESFVIIITIILALLGLALKKSKSLLLIQWFWIWVIQAFNCGGMDYKINEFIYNYGGEPNEWLSYIIIGVFNRLGIDYLWYRTFWFSISLIIVFYIVKHYSDNPCTVMFPYIFFLMADNTVQCRFFWAYSIVLLSYHFQISRKEKLSYLFIIMATGIHMSAFVFLLYPIIGKFTKQNSALKNLIILFVEIILFPNIDTILYQIFSRIGLLYAAEKLDTYIHVDTYNLTIVGGVFLATYAILISLSSYCILCNNEGTNINQFTLGLNRSSYFILPMLLFNSNFGRFFRPILFVDYVTLSNYFNKFKRGMSSHVALITVYILSVAVGFVLQSRAGFFAIDTLFNNNWIFNKM